MALKEKKKKICSLLNRGQFKAAVRNMTASYKPPSEVLAAHGCQGGVGSSRRAFRPQIALSLGPGSPGEPGVRLSG